MTIIVGAGEVLCVDTTWYDPATSSTVSRSEFEEEDPATVLASVHGAITATDAVIDGGDIIVTDSGTAIDTTVKGGTAGVANGGTTSGSIPEPRHIGLRIMATCCAQSDPAHTDTSQGFFQICCSTA
jgi:hypothetical protein